MQLPTPGRFAVVSRWRSRVYAVAIAPAIAAMHATGQTINVDVNSGSSNHYSGAGIVSGDSGTTWNGLNIGSGQTSVTIAAGSVKDSLGNTLPGVSVNIASSNGTSAINRYSSTTGPVANPEMLMQDYTYSGTYNVTVSGLASGTYKFWFFGHGNVDNQAGTVTVDVANGGGNGSTANSSLGRDLINGSNGVSYVFLDGLTVGSGGTFSFQVGNFLNGFQLQRINSAPPVADSRPSIFADAGAAAFTGTAVASDPGTTWNQLLGSSSVTSYTVSNVLASNGATVPGASLTVSSTDTQIRSYAASSPGNPSPLDLMRDYFFGGNFTISLSGLPQGNYFLYVFAHGDQANQNSTVTVAAANGGGSGATSAAGGDNRDLFAANAEGYSYLKFAPNVGAAGSLSFTATGYFTGFQLVPYPAPVVAIQPPPTPSATIGSNFVMTANATGPGVLSYRWQKNNADISDGATGNGSTYAGATTNTLTIQNLQIADAGDYSLVVTNPGGSVTSNPASLTVTTSPLAPSISNHPQNATVLSPNAAGFAVVANGTAPLSYVWKKDGNILANGPTGHGSTVSGADTANLAIANTQLSDAGSYQVVGTNSVNSATSNTAILTVNKAPGITTQPASAIVASGLGHTLSAVFGPSFPTPSYQWEKSADGSSWSNVTGGNSTSLALTGSLAGSGFYRVTATNSAGSSTSNVVYFGVPSTQAVTFAPANNATNLSIDPQLRLAFPSAPKLGLSGVLRVHDASNDAVVASIDRSQFQTFSLFSATIPNAMVRSVQGTSYFYMPLAIYGNELWITLSPSQRLAYAKTYYVTMDAGLIVDSTNAAYPGISSPTTWRFSTRAAGPATPTTTTGPTTITVGHDGAGDFATLQGASDWIPQNNTLPRTIVIKPGIYRDNATFAQNRNFVRIAGGGDDRKDVVIYYPYAAFSSSNDRGSGTLRIESNDVLIRDLTIDNGVYFPNPSNGAPAWAGPINTVFTTGSRLVFDNILMKGGQDTLYASGGIGYYHRSEIWGSVDFIYGGALAVFDDCDIVQIRSTGGPVCAPSTALAQPYGEVFLGCRFPRARVADGYPYDVNANSTTFMRPWRQDGATQIINCQLDTHISTKGWGEWGDREVLCRAREYGSTMIGGGPAATPAQRRAAGAYWLNTIDPDYTGAPMTETNSLVAPSTGTGNRQAVTVNPADYTLDAIFGHSYFNLNGWRPALVPRITGQPAGAAVDPGDPVTLSVVATGTPAPSYQWYRNGSILNGKTAASLSIPSATAGDAGSYTVIASNSGGSTESAAAMISVNDPEGAWASSFGLNPATNGAPGEDPDGDGLANRIEFLLGGSPVNGSLGAILPSASRSTSGPSAMIFRFNIAKAAANVAWSVETNSTLGGTWATAVHGVNQVTIVQAPLDANRDQVTVTIPTTESALFGRLRVAMP
jgi:pectin methylesterase-like acyl-CoA thioesterase